MNIKEIELDIPSGTLSGWQIVNPEKPTIIGLHGWLDNANSFVPLQAFLQEYNFISLDLPGHGKSSHRPDKAYLHYIEYLPDIMHAVERLGLQQVSFLGHSLGAGVASMIAGIFADKVKTVCLIDALGPLIFKNTQLVSMIQSATEGYSKIQYKRAPRYNNQQMAAKARMQATPMSQESVMHLLERGLRLEGHEFTWRTDPKLMQQPLVGYTEDQVEHILKLIQAPITIIRTEKGWPFGEQIFNLRTSYIPHIKKHVVAGNHHAHMDNPEVVGKIVQDFFQQHLD